jgi:hypothetical protein
MMYLANRGIAGRIKERANMKRRQGRLLLFNYRMYTKIRSSMERFFGWLKNSFYYCSSSHLDDDYRKMSILLILTAWFTAYVVK